MKTEFRRADPHSEIRSLMAFDRKVFAGADLFDAAYWRICESYWMIVTDIKVGCCAFEKHVDFGDDHRADGINPPRQGTLYISSTGILPRYQGMGFGNLLKSWEISYARHQGFSRIVTNTRKANAVMIALNRKFGFKTVRTTPGYYQDPVEATVVMELVLD
jgi:ribosomal protein S18 acetylase RimI-like enzyme